ncbi:hypothetical protein ADZ37_10480 [Pannonibacter phragmitetus]|nr:hypothetical protein ADZ37_10480 [Pannonibacter phragmitetus]
MPLAAQGGGDHQRQEKRLVPSQQPEGKPGGKTFNPQPGGDPRSRDRSQMPGQPRKTETGKAAGITFKHCNRSSRSSCCRVHACVAEGTGVQGIFSHHGFLCGADSRFTSPSRAGPARRATAHLGWISYGSPMSLRHRKTRHQEPCGQPRNRPAKAKIPPAAPVCRRDISGKSGP